MNLGDPLPPLTLSATGNKTITLSHLVGHNIVLYFYPRDDTPGCILEGQDFRDYYETFRATDTLVLGVSRDHIKKHEKFKAKYSFPFDLLSDEDEQLCQLFEVIKPKTMFGKAVMSIERSTFLFDQRGLLRYQWRKVKVPGHVKQVLEITRTL